jgi:hypothetical protein
LGPNDKEWRDFFAHNKNHFVPVSLTLGDCEEADMSGMGVAEHRVMVILPDNTALCFSAIEHNPAKRAAKRPWPVAPSPKARVGKFLKSLLPHVSKVSPVEAMLQSGRRLKLMTPPAVH